MPRTEVISVPAYGILYAFLFAVAPSSTACTVVPADGAKAVFSFSTVNPVLVDEMGKLHSAPALSLVHR